MSRDIMKWDEVNGRAEEDRIEAFLTNSTDTYAIFQLRHSQNTGRKCKADFLPAATSRKRRLRTFCVFGSL